MTIVPMPGDCIIVRVMPMQDEPWLSVVVTCMGRLDHLRRTIPALVEHAPGVEVILVDWSCPDGAGAYAREHWPEVRVVAIKNRVHFHKSAALNAGARVARAPWLAIFDADMIASTDFFEEVQARLRPDVLLGLFDERLAGFLVCRREVFDRAGGYDERMEGWGFEDDDMRRRLLGEGLRLERLPADAIELVPHGDERRTRFYAEKDPFRSALFNQALVWQARWTDPSMRREQWPARPLLMPSGPGVGALFRSVEFALHLQWRIGVPGVRLLCATSLETSGEEATAIERLLREMLDAIDTPGPVELVHLPVQDTIVPLPFGQWRFPYFPARISWNGWPEARAHRRIAVGQIHSEEMERLARAAPHFALTTLDAGVSIATAARILSEADLLVARGGGFVHLASAVGAPVFLLAGEARESAALFRDDLDLDVIVCHSLEDLITKVVVFLGAEPVAAG